MRRTRKIALVGREWSRADARILAGGLHYAGMHPSLTVVLQPFSKTVPPAELAASIERWGAEGIFGGLSDEEIQGLRAALKWPIPIVNNSGSNKYPGLIHVIGDAHAVVEMAVEHLRQFALKYFGLLWTDPPPPPESHWLNSFKKLTGQRGSVLFLPTPGAQLLDPNRNNQPVPALLVRWLRELPKPCGVLCGCVGSGRLLADCCAKLGLRVPDQIAIIGMDEADVCLSCTPPLTSITANFEMVGSESVRILLGMLDGITPPTPIIRISILDLIVRASTGQHPPAICDIAGAVEYIKANATKGLSVTQLMRATQRSSQPTFYESFYRATGRTPAQAIRDRQLEEVRRLLATTQLPVAVVSAMAGFSSPSVMARLFRTVEGMSSLEYRKQQDNELG